MISIIIPVYNVEKYLDKCIQSILNQSYKNFELILIDDGSTDHSKNICDKWHKLDSRIKTIYQKNTGVSKARNKGLSIAKGQYITFIDSDDWIAQDYLQTLITYIQKYNVDIIVSGIYNSFSQYFTERISLTESKCLNFKDAAKFHQLMTSQYMTSPACKLYKKELIDKYNILFNEKINLAEDREFNLRYINVAQTGYITSYVGYYYRRDTENSLTKKIHNTKFKYDCIHWKLQLNNYIERGFTKIEYIDEYLANELYNIVNDQLINDAKTFSFLSFKKIFKSRYSYVEFAYLLQHKNKIKSPKWKSRLLINQKLLFLFIIYKLRLNIYGKTN